MHLAPKMSTRENLISGLIGKIRYCSWVRPSGARTDPLFLGSMQYAKERPYLRNNLSLRTLLTVVIMAATPAAVASIYFYGWRAAVLILIACASGGAVEATFCRFRKEQMTGGFLVTGLLLTLSLPPTIPLWMVAVGSIVGLVLGKEIFGGLGKNVFNPALVGRVFLAVTFPLAMSPQWVVPARGMWGGFAKYTIDSVTSATPLAVFKYTGNVVFYRELFLGVVPGCLGETSKVLIIAGGIFLIFAKVSDWRVPVSYLGTVAFFSWVGSLLQPSLFASPLFQLLSGGLLFGALFMAADPVTSPVTSEGKWIYGIGLGILTTVIRVFSVFVEGVMFAILLMNLFAPALDELVITLRFGKVKKPYDIG